MKNFKTIAIALLVAFSASVSAQTKKIDVSKSTIAWVGKKVTGQHNGTVNFKDGSLTFKGKTLTGGTFNVDMTSIGVSDLSGDGKTGLEGHLKNEDFFGTDKFPTATIKFTKVAAKSAGVYAVTADLTIKGVTKPVSFDLAVKGNAATTAFKIDRTKYDIRYGSNSFFNLGDKAINDDFDVAVTLVW
jgi:polyisoprenoid-binding protein YceI